MERSGQVWEEPNGPSEFLVVGNRVARRRRGSSAPWSWGWDVLVDRTKIELNDELRELCEGIAPPAAEVESGWLLNFENRPAPAALSALVQAAATAEEPTELLCIWDLGRILGVRWELKGLLADSQRQALSKAIHEELSANIRHLTVETDAQLLRFSEGASLEQEIRIQKCPLPECRLTTMVEVEAFLGQHHRGLGEDYYVTRAEDYALLANPFEVATFLQEFPPSMALFDGFREAIYRRPEMVADWAFHFSFSAVAALALRSVPKYLHAGRGVDLDLRDEWERVQLLGRRLIVQDRAAPSELLALCIRDFSMNVRGSLEELRHDRDDFWTEEVWVEALRSDTLGPALLKALILHLNSDRADEFALLLGSRFLEWGDRISRDLRNELVRAIVDSYVGQITPRPAFRPGLRYLAACPGSLAVLWAEIGRESSLMERWLRPFEWKRLAQKVALEEGPIASGEHNYRLEVPQIVREHLEVLAVMGNAVSVSEPLATAVGEQVLEVMNLDWTVGPFSWHGLSRRTSGSLRGTRPLFQEIGALFARTSDGGEIIAKIAKEAGEVRILADLLGGAREAGFSPQLREQLVKRINSFLVSEEGIALGEALDASASLLAAGEPRWAERCARRAIKILEKFRPGQASPFQVDAQAYLAAALAEQGLWIELLESDLSAAIAGQNVFVRNLRVVAFLETEQPDKAEAELSEVFKWDPSNPTAWTNRIVLALKEGEPDIVQELVDQARKHLDSDKVRELERIADSAPNTEPVPPSTEPQLGRAVHPVPESEGGTESGALLEQARGTENRAPVELAVVTILDEEFKAVEEVLEDVEYVTDAPGEIKNLFGWTRGRIRGGQGETRVVLARTGRAGNIRASQTVMRTIDRFAPRYILLVGIAGGLRREGLRQGDIVVADSIWYYEYGKLQEGFAPRPRDRHDCDSGLVSSAASFRHGDWVAGFSPASQSDGGKPRCHIGTVGSGEKVVDDLTNPFAQAVLKADSKVLAFEMEAGGAASSVQIARDDGQIVGFGMVRGISDVPKDDELQDGSGTVERDGWKNYASSVAAHFLRRWVESVMWPLDGRVSEDRMGNR